MGDERFLLGEFQREFVAEKVSEVLLDCFRFGFRPNEAEQEIKGFIAYTAP